MAAILLVEDDTNARAALEKILRGEGHTVLPAADGEQALRLLADEPIDLLLSDLVLPGRTDGMEVFRACRRLRPDAATILMTAHGTIERAVSAMKEGAYDFLEKPLHADQMRVVVHKALAHGRLVAENRTLRERVEDRSRMANVVGESPPMQALLEKVRQVAATDATVLLLGESGTGKEVIANAIHAASARAEGPFVKVACSALAETLLESELFGHVKGAYTGANASRKGRFEIAGGGTLFLDEIGEVTAATQVKLLRFLQEGEFQPVGGNQTIRVDVRLITATNADLEARMAHGTLREDFYYRIKVVTLRVPPLREREGDVPLLAEHFASRFCREAGRPALAIPPETMAILERHPWPGNVRQLQNAIRTAVVLSQGRRARELTPDLLPTEIVSEGSAPRGPAPGGTDHHPLAGRTLAQIEREAIEATLHAEGGNKTRAAKVLKIGVRTLYRKIREYGIGEG